MHADDRIPGDDAAGRPTTPPPPGLSTTPIEPGEGTRPEEGRPDRAIGLRIGDSIDGFKILEAIGEGGMGVVYLAEQLVPVKRRIALKVIKPGMDSKAVLARFEAERQALALMDHPGIARVLQAGTTDRGLPYFAMEYVKGVPITDAADRNQLDTTQRLELMRKVCDAVQHAHMKGIIHRDLKPSNILVTTDANDELVAKIIDFGVAKATTQQLTDLTVHTQVGHFIGTPAYMSPEQADLTAADIDTRTDVYSLGVILYELLTGRLPFDPGDLGDRGDKAFEEMRRRICEDDPPKPSSRIAGLDREAASRVAGARRIGIDQLERRLARELDWIPLKAMRKLRGERYAGPNDLGRDLQRYLAGEPLEAGPESVSYRLRKFVKRWRGPIVVGSSVVTLLLVATGVSVWFATDASAQRRVADRNFRIAEESALIATKERNDAYAERIRASRSNAAIRTKIAASHLAANERVAAERVLASVEPGRRAWDWWVVASFLDGVDSEPAIVEGRLTDHPRILPGTEPGLESWIGEVGFDGDLELIEGELGGPFDASGLRSPRAISPDARFLAVADRQALFIIDLGSRLVTLRLPIAGTRLVSDLAFTPDGTALMVEYDLATIRVMDAVPTSVRDRARGCQTPAAAEQVVADWIEVNLDRRDDGLPPN